MEIQYRPGEKKDSTKLAELIAIAAGGVVEYLFNNLVPGISPLEVIAHNLADDNYPHSYKNTVVAEDGNDLVGMALSYPAAFHQITDEMRSFFPPERLQHLSAFYSAVVENSWYLDALGVVESHRRRGIGENLISFVREKAAENGFKALSLIVFADNQLAIPFYKRAGFKTVQKVELRENEFIQHKGGCLLMKSELAG
jgi:ribosomal protein S18 acetylase RimI-like enzyme